MFSALRDYTGNEGDTETGVLLHLILANMKNWLGMRKSGAAFSAGTVRC